MDTNTKKLKRYHVNGILKDSAKRKRPHSSRFVLIRGKNKEELVMKIAMSIFIIVFGLVVVGCNDTGTEEGGGFIPAGNIIAVAERGGSNQTIKVGGTAGAVPPGSRVEVTNINTGETQVTVGDNDGSFDPTFVGNTNDIFNILVTDDGAIVEDTTIGVTLLSQAVRRDIARLGSVPTAIEIRGSRAYVINGFSNNIQVFDLEQNAPQQIGTIVLPQGSNPVAMAFLDDTTAYVANNIGQSVAMVNLQTRQCELIIANFGQGNNFPPCQEVRLVASGFEDPSDIAIANGKIYVSNNNLDQNFEPAASGFISVIDAETNQFVDQIPASGANTGGMTVVGNKIYVVNAGDIFFMPDSSEFFCDFDFPPSIDVIDVETDSIIDTIDILLSETNEKVCLPNRIAPTPDGRFGYMGLGLVGALLKVNLETDTVVNGPSNPIVVTDISGLNNTADIEINNQGFGFITLFNSDQIAVIDTANDEISPFPFSFFFPAGIRADNPNSDLFDGVQFLSIRQGTPGVDFQGADVFYTTSISSQLGSVNTSQVLPSQ